MKHVWLWLVIVVAFAMNGAAPAVEGRFWFSTSGVGENQPIQGTPGEYSGWTQGTNPRIDPAAQAATRLYLWGTLDPFTGGYFNAVGLDVNVHLTAGDVRLVDSRMYNYVLDIGARRWTSITQGDLSPQKLDDAFMVATGNWGFMEYLPDLQYDPQTRSMLLGFIDLLMTPDARAAVFLGVGQGGCGGAPPIPEVYFGWGDERLRGSAYGQESRLPDATIVPEPTSVCLLLIGGAGLLRRR